MNPELPVLLVLDTVARCMAPGADENSIQGLGAFINNLLDIVVRPTKSTAICVHHSGHGDSDRGRGHSSFEGAVDGIIKVCMDKGSGPPVITVASGRSRSTAGDDIFSFRVETQELPGEDNFRNPIDAPVLRYLEDYGPAKSEKRLKGNALEALHLLDDMITKQQEKFREMGAVIPSALVKLEEWQEAMRSIVKDKGSRSSIRKSLIADGYVTGPGGYGFIHVSAKGKREVGNVQD